jgi:hypothetical protein
MCTKSGTSILPFTFKQNITWLVTGWQSCRQPALVQRADSKPVGVKLTSVFIISLTNFNAQFFIQKQYVCYIIIPDMFRALTCPSSGGKIVFTQNLVFSLSVNVCTVHRLSTCVLCRRLQRAKIPDDVWIQSFLLKMGMLIPETCRG